MLKEFISAEKKKRNDYLEQRKINAQRSYERAIVLRNKLNNLSNGLLDIEIRTESNDYVTFSKLVIQKPFLINITNTSDDNIIKVSSFNVFSLMGDEITIEQFLKRIAPYIL